MLYVFLVLNCAILGLITWIHNRYVQKDFDIIREKRTVAPILKDGLSQDKYKAALLNLKQTAQGNSLSPGSEKQSLSPVSEKHSLSPVCEKHSSIWQTESEMLMTLIDYYKRTAFSKHILFSANISESLTDEQIREYHLIHIAGNLLQNAIEALEALPECSPRCMGIWIECEDEEICLRVHNSYPEDLRQTADLQKWCTPGYSTKGKEDRGQGLPILKKLVTQQDGVIYLDTEQGISFIVEFAG